MPTTWSGRRVATEISVTDSEEVFVARIVGSGQIRSSSAKMRRLISSCSGTVSMTRSAARNAFRPTAKVTRPSSASRSGGESLPRLTARSVDPVRVARPRSRAASSTSTAITSIPLRAKTSTIPDPMVPRPTTPTVRISRAIAASASLAALAASLPCHRRAGSPRYPRGERDRRAARRSLWSARTKRRLNADPADPHGCHPSAAMGNDRRLLPGAADKGQRWKLTCIFRTACRCPRPGRRRGTSSRPALP